MKFKKLKKAGLILMTCVMMLGCTSLRAFAYADPDSETEESDDTIVTSDGITIEEIQESVKESTESSEDDSSGEDIDSYTKPTDEDYSGVLTPDGNLTLVDDLDEAESEELQYMTVTTRDGSYFYIIVDRSGSEDNVYFLNAVDAEDLMSLMSDDEQEKYESIVAEEDTESADAVSENSEEEEANTLQKNETKKTGNFGVLIAFAVIAAAALGAYYFLKIKKDKEKPDIDEDLEFYDDEEYENEEAENEDAGVETESDDIEIIDLDAADEKGE